MKIKKINENIKCDSILCFNNDKYEILTNSYKGNEYWKIMKNIFMVKMKIKL